MYFNHTFSNQRVSASISAIFMVKLLKEYKNYCNNITL
jgi:hypothetical protein